MEDIKTIGELLIWLRGPGAVALVMWAASWAFEGWEKWENLSRKSKSGIILAVASVIGIAAQYFQTQPELLDVLAPYVNTLISIAGAWLVTQVAHKKNPDR